MLNLDGELGQVQWYKDLFKLQLAEAAELLCIILQANKCHCETS